MYTLGQSCIGPIKKIDGRRLRTRNLRYTPGVGPVCLLYAVMRLPPLRPVCTVWLA